MQLKFYPIYRRELRSYLTSPSVYIAVAMYFFLSGMFFYGILENFSQLSSNAEYRREVGMNEINFTLHVVSQVFWSVNFLMLFVVPVFTMRLLAEEKKSGTFEFLASLPFSDWNIVTAKFLAAYTLVGGMMVVGMYYVLVMYRFGAPEMPVVWVAYFGSLLAAASYVAIGLFASSLTENQIVAAIIAFVLLLGFFMIGDVTAPASRGINRLLEALSMRYHSEQLTRGLIRIEDVAYFAMIMAVFLFLTCRNLEIRRWKV